MTNRKGRRSSAILRRGATTVERIAMALFNTHGFDTATWPGEVRRLLWPAR